MEENNHHHPSATANTTTTTTTALSSSSTTTTTTTSLDRKHAAMIQRLSDLHNSPKPNPPSSTTTTFLTNFFNSKLSIESQISHLHQTQSTKSNLDTISSSISDLEQLLATNSYLLPSYELRSCLDSISNLKSSLNSFVPRKKFSFKNKSHFKNPTNPIARKNVVSEFEKNEIFSEFGKNPTNSIAQKSVVSEVGNNENNEAVNEFRKSYDSPGFEDRENEVLVKDFRNTEVGEFVLVNLEGCEVRLIGCFRALFVHKLKNCRVYVGPVHGSFLIEEVEDCVFVLASHQIRIHHAKRCDFYLRVRSRPIIEDSNAVRFAPYCLRYDEIDEDLEKANLGEESGNWGNVDDFKWLRAVQSPNWSVLREDDRIGTICISSSDGAADC